MPLDVRRRSQWLLGSARRVSPCLLALLIAACGGPAAGHDARPSLPPPPSTSSSASPAASNLALATESSLFAAYAGTYVDVETAVRVGKVDSAVLGQHAVDGALDQLRQGVEQYLNLGVLPIGVPDLHARVSSVDLDTSPAQAVVSSCPAAPRLVNRETGKPVTFKALPANPVTVDLQTLQGRWVVAFFKVDRSRSCSG